MTSEQSTNKKDSDFNETYTNMMNLGAMGTFRRFPKFDSLMKTESKPQSSNRSSAGAGMNKTHFSHTSQKTHRSKNSEFAKVPVMMSNFNLAAAGRRNTLPMQLDAPSKVRASPASDEIQEKELEFEPHTEIPNFNEFMAQNRLMMNTGMSKIGGMGMGFASAPNTVSPRLMRPAMNLKDFWVNLRLEGLINKQNMLDPTSPVLKNSSAAKK